MTEAQEVLKTPIQPKPRIELDAVKDFLAQFLETKKVIVAAWVAVILSVSPHLLAQPDQLEEPICDLERVFRDGLITVTLECDDIRQSEVSLEFILTNMQVSDYSEGQITNPPLLDSQYLDDERNPNFNCHSFTLQLLEQRYGFDVGASRATWLERGFDQFIAHFGQEIASGGIEYRGDVLFDSSQLQDGDVVLFFDAAGMLVHSATVNGQTEDGRWLIDNKLGQAGLLEATISGIAWYYRLDGEYVEDGDISEGGGTVRVYRMNGELLSRLPDTLDRLSSSQIVEA